MTKRLSAALAERDQTKKATNARFTGIQKALKQTDLFGGLTKEYQKKDEDGDDAPAESVRVRARVPDLLDELSDLLTASLNAEAAVDEANTSARGNISVNGEVLLEGVPVTTLLTIERDLKQVRATLENLPTLDPAFAWTKDEAAGLFRTNEIRTNRTKKVQKPIVLYDATDKHPAQTQLITTDEVVGAYVTTLASGAVPADDKKGLLRRCDLLISAVQEAREEANTTYASKANVGGPLLDFLLER